MRFPFRVTDPKALKDCLSFTWKTNPVAKSLELVKKEKILMEQNSPVETFQSVREDNLFKQTVHSEKIPVGPSKYACSIYCPYEIISGISM
jgi:hypothetical protein